MNRPASATWTNDHEWHTLAKTAGKTAKDGDTFWGGWSPGPG